MWDSNPLSAYDIALLVRGFFMENETHGAGPVPTLSEH